MKKYSIELSKQALKYYFRLDRKKREKIDEILGDLENGCFEEYDIIHMKWEPAYTFRLRFGDFRIIYDLREDLVYIFILKIWPRWDVYK